MRSGRMPSEQPTVAMEPRPGPGSRRGSFSGGTTFRIGAPIARQLSKNSTPDHQRLIEVEKQRCSIKDGSSLSPEPNPVMQRSKEKEKYM